MSILYYYPELDEDDFYVGTSLDDDEKEVTHEGGKRPLLAHFKEVYLALETQESGRAKRLAEHIGALSLAFVEPFAEQFRRASEVRIVVNRKLVDCLFDLLELDGKPLFLSLPVSYVVDDEVPEYEAGVNVKSGLILADLSADPEKGCEAVHRTFPGTNYFEVDEQAYERVSNLDTVDLLLISGHGDLEGRGGEIGLEDDSLTSEELGELGVTLTYFDSCQMGINWDFVETFYEQGSCRYYLAPVISNDAGDSSTRTLRWFFEGIKEHGRPEKALFETRKKLFEHYTKAGKKPVVVLNKAFPFRLYVFDNEE